MRSAVFRIDVADKPYVKRIDLEYRFPAYTGLPPQKIENGGDVAALAGTEVRLRDHADDAGGRAAGCCSRAAAPRRSRPRPTAA